MYRIKPAFLALLLLLFQLPFKANGQELENKQEADLDKQKLKKLILTESVIYTGTMAGLGFIWYNQEEGQSFRFFNDNQQWLQMDKAGHVYTAYHLSNANAILLQNAGFSQPKALLLSGIASSFMMLPIEILDGYSPAYGASWGDLAANTVGAFLPLQQLIWSENYLHPKFSFSPSGYAASRPAVLGATYYEQWLKDYNGQTYWLSANLNLFSKENIFPDWLAVSVGYSGRQMVYGSPTENLANGYRSQRQLFLSMDIDFSKIETEQKWLRPLLYIANMIKIPFPALEWRGKQVILHPIYF